MSLQQRLNAFENLGKALLNPSEELREVINTANIENPWFSVENCFLTISNIAKMMLTEAALSKWIKPYSLQQTNSKKIGIVAAGNIPLVSFHDILCVLISGHHLMIKLSEKDKALTTYILSYLSKQNDALKNNVSITGRLSDFDAVIATGSDNSARYFDYYFQKHPNIIRRNRTSIAVLQGKESDEELLALTHDIFDYYGLGCRNVSHLIVPEGYDFTALAAAMKAFSNISNHHKYRNNLDYQRTVYLMNSIPFLNIDHVNMVENKALLSPVSCLHYHYSASDMETNTYILQHRDQLQCICGDTPLANTAFGETQRPGLSDYADNIDTMSFLCALH